MRAAEITGASDQRAVDDPALPGPVHALVDAILVLSGDLELRSVLTRLVEAAASLTDARYGALGVLAADGTMSEFITTGIDEIDRAMIGAEPRGRGILGVLTDDPRPLRLDDLTRHPSAVGMPAHHPPMFTFLGVPIRIRDTVFGNLYLTEKHHGRRFTEQDEVLVQALANAAGMVIENARAYGLSERRRQWLEASAELAEALDPPIDLDVALAEIARRARHTADAAAVAIVQFPAQEHPFISASDGAPLDEVRKIVARVIDAARSADESSVAIDVDLGSSVALVLPLRAHLADAGSLIAVFDTSSGPEEREFLAAFVDQAGLALDRAQAVVDREQLAVVSERARIARDLHDVVIQRLFAAGLKLQGLRPPADQAEIDARIESVVDDLDLTIKDIRTTIFDLQQPVGSLRITVDRLISDYAGVLGFKPTLRTQGPLDTLVAGPVAEHLLAVLREAMSNVARHAGARQAAVEIDVTTDRVELRVTDNGVGIPVHRTESGLRNARDRAELLGGTLVVVPSPGPGTTLTWTCPLLGPA